MKTFIPKDQRYQGVQFTGENRDRVAKFLEVEVKDCVLWRNEDNKECHINITAPKCNLGPVAADQWVLRNERKDHFVVLSEADLKTMYEELG